LLIITTITIKTLQNGWYFWKKSFKKNVWGIHLNVNWSKRYKELIQLLGDLDILSFVRISQLIWIGAVNRLESKRKVSQVFNNNPQGSWLRGQPKTGGGTVYKSVLIDAKLKTGEVKKQSWLEEIHYEVKVHISL